MVSVLQARCATLISCLTKAQWHLPPEGREHLTGLSPVQILL